MKITDVRAVQPIAPNSPPDWRTSMGQILVAIDTDKGLTGYGVGGGGMAGIHVIKSVLRDILLDRDPQWIADLWDEMYDATLPFGRKGLAIMAISGVDLALWDLLGKMAQQPVVELLDGQLNKPIPTYVTVWDAVTPEIAQSHKAFKLHVENKTGTDLVDSVVHAVEQARETVGDGPPLMLDAWMRWDIETTLQVADRVANFGVDWIEEPLPADDLAGYAELVNRSAVPIAGGEHEFTALAFQELIDRKLHQVLQPDVCWCGGQTELNKIYRMANAAGVRVCPHRGSELWGLHAIAAYDPQPLAESGRPWMAWVGGQPPIIDAFIQIPDRPGYGVVIDEDSLQTL